MNYGKLSEDVYERTVVKVIRDNSNENKMLYHGAEIGSFCAVSPYKDTVFLSAQASAGGKHAIRRAYEAALNTLSAKGESVQLCGHAYAQVTLFVPERLREIKVREMIAETAHRADVLRIPIMSVDVEVLAWIEMETANCVVFAQMPDYKPMQGALPGDDIVMTKWLAPEGTALIARSSTDTLKARYPSDMIDAAADFLNDLSVITEAATAVKSGASDMQAAREGGVFGGLWELAARNSVGLVADLKSIPVRQETVEVCEYFDLNPYELMAGGSLLITCQDGNAMVRALSDCKIASSVIGKITQGNDRIIRHEDENRFLNPPRGDEIYQYYKKRLNGGLK